jgi:hypothetical protein
MPTTIYDSSLITQRRRATAESGSFVTRISPWNVQGLNIANNPPTPVQVNFNQPNTGYAPALGIYDQSIINTVKNGQMKFFRKNDGGCTTVFNGCPCLPPLPVSAAS